MTRVERELANLEKTDLSSIAPGQQGLVNQKLLDEYERAHLAGKRQEAVAAVPDELVDDVHLVGPADRIRERLAVWKEAGKNRHVDTMIVGTRQREALELCAEELL